LNQGLHDGKREAKQQQRAMLIRVASKEAKKLQQKRKVAT
jgi:hypothetical protein